MSSSAVTLTVKEGTLDEKELVFVHPAHCLIGRATDCDIHIPGNADHLGVSRHHCDLEIDPPSIRVRDVGSLNGTYVNGRMIGRRTRSPNEPDSGPSAVHELHDGDELMVGDTVFRVAVSIADDMPVPLFLPWQ